jgi:hypothetical protein
MAHKTKESRKKKNKKNKALQLSPHQTVLEEGQRSFPQSTEYQVSIPGLDIKRISPELLPRRQNLLLLY